MTIITTVYLPALVTLALTGSLMLAYLKMVKDHRSEQFLAVAPVAAGKQ